MRLARHLIAVVLMLSSVAFAEPARADVEDEFEQTGNDAITLIATADGDYVSTGRGTGSIRCSLWHIPSLEMPVELTGQVTDPVEGAYYLIWCVDADDVTVRSDVIVWDPTTAITIPQLADEARDQLRVRVVRPATSPVTGETLPGIETWFWAREGAWQSSSATASASVPGYSVTVTATATPYRMDFDFGDGERLSCTANGGRGTAYRNDLAEDEQPADRCTHVFQRAGRHTVSVRTWYSVSVTSSTGSSPAVGDLFADAALTIDVVDRQAVVTG